MQMTHEGVTLEATRVGDTRIAVSVVTVTGTYPVDVFRGPDLKSRGVENGRDGEKLLLNRLLRRAFHDKKNSIKRAADRGDASMPGGKKQNTGRELPATIDYEEANKRLAYRRDQAAQKRAESAPALEALGVKVISA
jgi:hypothetical protein